jgi:imidazoleglycerol phosphate dehydratase HisB
MMTGGPVQRTVTVMAASDLKRFQAQFQAYVDSLKVGCIIDSKVVPVLILEATITDSRMGDITTQLIKDFGDTAPFLTLPSVVIDEEKADNEGKYDLRKPS